MINRIVLPSHKLVWASERKKGHRTISIWKPALVNRRRGHGYMLPVGFMYVGPYVPEMPVRGSISKDMVHGATNKDPIQELSYLN